MTQKTLRSVLRAVIIIALGVLSVIAVVDLTRRDTQTLVVDGVERSYELVITGQSGSEPMPLVFVFHGRNGTSAAIRRRTELDTAARALGDHALFVYPQGVELPNTHVVGWQVECDGPDMRFLDEVVHQVAARHAIDRRRIFASGFSWGAEMAIAYGCCRHESVRAIAPMSGGTWDSVKDSCRKHAPAFRIGIGGSDSIVPANVLQHIVQDFRVIQGCSERSHESDPYCRAFEDCREPVIECAYPTMGHALPPNAGREIWSFLRSFGK